MILFKCVCQSYLVGGGDFWGSLHVQFKNLTDDKMNHCFYYGTVKTNTSMHLNSSAGNSQFGLSLGPSHWWCGKPQVVNVSQLCVVNDTPFPAPPLAAPAATPFQVTCNISHRLYRPSTLSWPLSEREKTIRNDWICASPPPPTPP